MGVPFEGVKNVCRIRMSCRWLRVCLIDNTTNFGIEIDIEIDIEIEIEVGIEIKIESRSKKHRALIDSPTNLESNKDVFKI